MSLVKNYIDLDPTEDIIDGKHICECGKVTTINKFKLMFIDNEFKWCDNNTRWEKGIEFDMICDCGQKYNVFNSIFTTLNRYIETSKGITSNDSWGEIRKYRYSCFCCEGKFNYENLYNLLQAREWFNCPYCSRYIITGGIGELIDYNKIRNKEFKYVYQHISYKSKKNIIITASEIISELKSRKLNKYIFIFKQGHIFRFNTNQVIQLETIPDSNHKCKLCDHIHSKQDYINKLNEAKSDRIDIPCKCNFTFVIARNDYKYSGNEIIRKHITDEILNNDKFIFEIDHERNFDDDVPDSDSTDSDSTDSDSTDSDSTDDQATDPNP